MNKKFYPFIIFFSILDLIFFYNIRNNAYVRQQVDAYADSIAEQQFGSERVPGEYEEMIRGIAQEMGVCQPFLIRKMSPRALALFGYYNAFAYFPLLFNCFPIGSQAFLFVSQGFFEDLSPEEQRFLIGHEMVHIKECHTQYLSLILYVLCILLLIAWWLAVKYIGKVFLSCGIIYHGYIARGFSALLFCLCLVIPNLVGFAYRRHIEWEADCASLGLLHTYNGGIKLMDRWQKEFKVPLHNAGWGLLADHPSCHDRKMYCMNIKNSKKGIL